MFAALDGKLLTDEDLQLNSVVKGEFILHKSPNERAISLTTLVQYKEPEKETHVLMRHYEGRISNGNKSDGYKLKPVGMGVVLTGQERQKYVNLLKQHGAYRE